MKKVISSILIFIILFSCLSIESLAKLDYDLDIPSNYEEVSDDIYEDGKNHAIGIYKIEDVDFDDDEDEFYTNDNLNQIITLLHQKMVTYGDIKVVEKGIIKFTENKYDSLEFVFEINMGNVSQYDAYAQEFIFYQKYYVVCQDDDVIVVCIQSPKYEYFDSKELTEIIDSLTIEGLIGRKQKIEFIWKTTIFIGAILVGIIILIGIYNKIREEQISKKADEILRQQALAERKTERERQKMLEMQKAAEPKRIEKDDGITFSTTGPNLVNGSFDIRHNLSDKDCFTTNETEKKKIKR